MKTQTPIEIPKHPLRQGFTIVELLVAGTILTILLGALTAFFVQHAQITRRTQARNEIESIARTIAELVVQDLEIAGSTVIVNGGVSSAVDMFCSAALETKCIVEPSGSEDKLTVFYATSLRPTTPCRRIDYRLTSTGTLQRAEQAESGVNCRQLENAVPDTNTFNLSPIADNITSFEISYHCADDRVTTDPATCYAVNTATGEESFPRQATVTVQGFSSAVDDISAGVTLTATMPNLKR